MNKLGAFFSFIIISQSLASHFVLQYCVLEIIIVIRKQVFDTLKIKKKFLLILKF